MLGEEPRRVTGNYEPAALQHRLSDHHFAIRELLDQRGHELGIMLLDIDDAEHE